MRAIASIVLLFLAALPAGAGGPANPGSLDLLAGGGKSWTPNVDSGKTSIALSKQGASVAVSVAAAGEPEGYPKLYRDWATPQNWSGYLFVHMRVRVICSDPTVVTRALSFVFYDANTRRADLPDHPLTQQTIAHDVPVGQWIDFEDRLLPIHRTAIRGMAVYLYESPPSTACTYRWEFQRLDLVGAGQKDLVFDGCVLPEGTFPRTTGVRRYEVSTRDGLALDLTASGAVSGAGLDGRRAASAPPYSGGLMVRDAAAGGPPVPAIGKVSQQGGVTHFVGSAKGLDVAVTAAYRACADRIEISGTVADRRRSDRALTLYFALPLRGDGWTWWDSVSSPRRANGDEELAYLEGDMACGLHGAHSEYPIGAVTSGAGGLTLGVRMDEPVIHRIACNPSLRLFYIAFDFGLTSGRTHSGRSLSEAPFRILLYRHDPRWGFRSALDRYYHMFPQFFVRHTPREGGWWCWGDVSKVEGALEAGFGEHWGPGGYDAVKWDAAHGVNSFLYIEPEFYQQTMGETATVPTAEQGIARLRKLAAGDPDETARFCKLSYAGSYTPGDWVQRHSLAASVQAVARAAERSGIYGMSDRPLCLGGKYPWMGESGMGVMFPCNLDPDIPNGKGWFASEIYLKPELAHADQVGAHYDGVGLDSFGGYGQCCRVDFRRENFVYADEPLCFDSARFRPVRVAAFASVKFLRRLAEYLHATGRYVMANCSWSVTPGWLTFAAPYLDVFGAEAPSFIDPDFIRAIARTKTCTDLPYDPRPAYELPLHLLHAIYPGMGNKIEEMKRVAPTLRKLAAAGWDPITKARVNPNTVRLERFGEGTFVYFVLHNPTDKPVAATIKVDPSYLWHPGWEATLLPDGKPLTPNVYELRVDLPALGTRVVMLRRVTW